MEHHIFDFYQSSMETELHGNRGHQKFSCLNKKVKCHDEKPVYSFRPDQGSNYRFKGRTWKTHQKINMKVSHHSRKTERKKTLGSGRLDAADSQNSKRVYMDRCCVSAKCSHSLYGSAFLPDQWASVLLKYTRAVLLPNTRWLETLCSFPGAAKR